ncbi:MAG: hypothetical protein A2252_08880 [Elusimicrobia bacterium RIFOXYA2_FULL_39_19]|nr:MAG: hypothetical protein A2252_08880 [Elusimicrobia bacterium RIFOXYA2_FULL_39_19]
MKKIYIQGIVYLLLLASVLFLPHKPAYIQDITKNIPSTDFTITTEWYQFLIEPFTGIPDYFLSFRQAQKQALSWLFWLFIFSIFFSIILKKERNIVKILSQYYSFLIWFFITITFVLFFPLPKYYISQNNQNFILVDFHSHTFFSHDGIVTPEESQKWHRIHKFDAFYITDHDRNFYRRIQKKLANHLIRPIMLPGEELSDTTGSHYLALGLERSIFDQKNRNITFFSSKIHKKNGVILAAHWWQEKAIPLASLLKSSIDGFEIFGHEKKYIDNETLSILMSFCRDNKLAAIAGTNWHGWGTRNDLWTYIAVDKNIKKTKSKYLNKFIVETLSSPDSSKISGVLTITNNQTYSHSRIFFEPFYGLYYYITGQTTLQRIFFVFWVILLTLLVSIFLKNKELKRHTYIIFAILFFTLFLSFFFKWLHVSSLNKTLLALSGFYLLLSAMLVGKSYFLSLRKSPKSTSSQ